MNRNPEFLIVIKKKEERERAKKWRKKKEKKNGKKRKKRKESNLKFSNPNLPRFFLNYIYYYDFIDHFTFILVRQVGEIPVTGRQVMQ